MCLIGVDHCLITSDFGQIYSPSPVEGFRHYITTMLNCGLSSKEIEIEIMINRNPAILLGLKFKEDS